MTSMLTPSVFSIVKIVSWFLSFLICFMISSFFSEFILLALITSMISVFFINYIFEPQAAKI